MMNRAKFLCTSLLGQVPRRTKTYTGTIKGTMNDLPQPCGNWKTNYDAKQRKYNAQLLIGIAFMTVTIIVGKGAGLLYINGTIPDQPAEKNDYSR